MADLVLSLFPGIGLLDKAFEEAGFCVVRGPDILWGGDVRRFTPPAHRFDGIIGGPPCKAFSPLANIVRARWGEAAVADNLIPEYERVVAAAKPRWFLMENVTRAPLPSVAGFIVRDTLVSNRALGEIQNRIRRFSFGTSNGASLTIDPGKEEAAEYEPTVTGNNGGRRAKIVLDANGRPRGKQGHADHQRLQRRPIARLCQLQGLPSNYFDDLPFTSQAAREAIGNGVPLAMGRALAGAVLRALEEGRNTEAAA